MKVKALYNQTVLDLLLQTTGSLLGLMLFAQANGIAITDDLEIGREYIVPEGIYRDVDIADYYRRNKIMPATAILNEETVLPVLGLGDMMVEINLEVG